MINYEPQTNEYARINDLIMNGLRQWVLYGHRPGDFLRAVLRNDFKIACVTADEYNRLTLYEIALYVINRMPMNCQGSVENVDAWAEQGGFMGMFENAEDLAVARDADLPFVHPIMKESDE